MRGACCNGAGPVKRPQIGTDLFIDTDTGMVPYGRSYEGNVVDATRFPVALEAFHKQYPYLEDITLLLDRGPVSEESLILLRSLAPLVNTYQIHSLEMVLKSLILISILF